MKLKLTIGLAVLLTASLLSCSKDEGNNMNTEGLQITIMASNSEYTDVNGTRTNITSGYARWDTAPGVERIGLFLPTGARELTGVTTDGGLTMNFSGYMLSTLANGTHPGLACYPFSAITGNISRTVELPHTQWPLLKSFDPKADLMYAVPFNVVVHNNTITHPISTQFKHAIALVKVVFKGIETAVEGQAITKFTLTRPTNTTENAYLAGERVFNMETGAFGGYRPTSHETVTALYDASVGLGPNVENGIYLCVFPYDIPTGKTLIFYAETEDYKISKTVTTDVPILLEAGKITTLNVSGATITPQY